MEQSPLAFYQNRVKDFKQQLKAIKQRLFWVAMLRLSLFLCTGGLIYVFHKQANIAFLIGVFGLALFLYLISKNTDIKLKKRKFEKLRDLNELEIRILNDDLQGVEGGEEFIGEEHYYNQDIDLFGQGSIFQKINRTGTVEGKKSLANILNSNDINTVNEKQNALLELKDKAVWRQNFQATAALIKTPIKNATILNWLNNYERKIPSALKYLPLAFSVLSFGLFGLYGFGFIVGQVLVVWLFVGLIITGFYLKKISKLYLSAGQMTDTFAQYSKLLSEIENQDFKASLLIKEQDNIKTESKKASDIFNELSKELNSLDQRNNILFAFVANGFFLWDLRYAYRIEKWIEDYRNLSHNWFRTISKIDAYNSLANYHFNHPTHIRPEVSDAENVLMTATALGHPLLNESQRVSNDFKIDKEDFFIITGANMAGKSTFLRTVALNLVMANVGLPVCAKSFVYKPIKLISSMRTSDSLVNDESYFFSELKRLKFIVDEIKQDRYFIILDEILKGTNSKDKEEGSKKFVEKLVKTNSNGIIATHDLSLCELAHTVPQIENHYFDAEIVNDELFFDYRFKDGICQNMNASFLLRKMEIV